MKVVKVRDCLGKKLTRLTLRKLYLGIRFLTDGYGIS